MKKNFVKYFGVASTTLLAVAPVATPALMTASNLTVVKAGVQDDITAAFKADNSLVQLSDDQWKGLTSTIVNENPDGPTSIHPATQAYLNELNAKAKQAKDKFKEEMLDSFDSLYTNPTVAVPIDSTASTPKGYRNWLDDVSGAGLNPIQVPVVATGNGQDSSTIRSADIAPTINDWASVLTGSNIESNEVAWNRLKVFPDSLEATGSVNSPVPKGDARAALVRFIDSVPVWWFIQKGSASNASFVSMSDNSGYDNIFNARGNVFTAIKTNEPVAAGNGLVTVAPNGGVTSNTNADNPDLWYVGDNLVDLQKRTDNEIANLVPANNLGKNRSGVEFSDVKGKFNVPGGQVTAESSVKEGSKVWSTILKSVLNSKDAMFPLTNLITGNIVRSKMLVNGKDATKNEFITKDEIQNADRISIQFVFKTNDGNEYKSPTIWLSHGAKYTVNTSGLANISRLPGDFYQPSAGITGTFNETGLPMDSKKFVVVPAGTDLANYTDKDGKVDLSALAALQSGVLGTNGVAVNRNYNTAFEGGKLSPSQYWTNPSYFYSKFGVYNDAVDIYYIDGTPSGGTTTASQDGTTKLEQRSKAADAVYAKLNSELAKVAANSKVRRSSVFSIVNQTLSDYVSDGSSYEIQGKEITPNLVFGKKPIQSIFYTNDPAGFPIAYLTSRVTTSGTPTNNAYPFGATGSDVAYQGLTAAELFQKMVNELPIDDFKEVKAVAGGDTPLTIPSYQLNKVVANAARTTKVDVPSKYLPQVSFNDYKAATYYGNGATINNWFNYSWNSGSSANSGNDPYYPSGGVIVTGGTSAASSSAAKQPVSYLAPAAFAANSINADQLQARVADNIQKFMSAKLSNPNTQSDSNVNGYFKGYKSTTGTTGDAAYAYIKNGAVPASDLKIDTSKVDVTKPGTYYVEVTYTPLSTIKSNTFDGNLAATNGNVDITDANGKLFEGGRIGSKDFSKSTGTGATVASTGAAASTVSDQLTTFAADQIFANGAPATYKLPVQITDGSNAPQSGAPVIAFTEGGQNLKIAKGGTFDQFKGLQFYAYPGAKAWDQKDDSVKVEVSGSVNTNVEGTYTLVYTVTNKAGKTSTLTRVITVGDGVEKPTEYEFSLSQAYIDYVPGYNVREYGYPGDEWTGKQIKHGTSVSVTKRAVFQNGEEWYKLGDGNWVKKQYVKAGQNPNEAVEARGVVTVNYVPGYGIAVYKEPGKSALVQVNGKPKRLAHGTSWKAFKKQTVNNVTYYNVGGNQWVNGNFVIFK